MEIKKQLAKKTLERYDSMKKGEARRVLYNPDQSSEEEALSDQLELMYSKTRRIGQVRNGDFTSPGYNLDEAFTAQKKN